jgi:hypothetical protein
LLQSRPRAHRRRRPGMGASPAGRAAAQSPAMPATRARIENRRQRRIN